MILIETQQNYQLYISYQLENKQKQLKKRKKLKL